MSNTVEEKTEVVRWETRISTKEAYLAMYIFLDERYKRCTTEAVGSVLGDLCLVADGTPLDSKSEDDWFEAVSEVRRSSDGDLRKRATLSFIDESPKNE